MLAKLQYIKFQQRVVPIRNVNGKKIGTERHLQMVKYNVYMLLFIIPIFYSEELLSTDNVDEAEKKSYSPSPFIKH